ncbi:SIMPL domain-containing protein [Motiliproteus sp.]|uniref:SIMPL domain-containing protein n=1 Tax=Motiliproteus sp. TaxID=1898955 RepID=UPI003BA8C83B
MLKSWFVMILCTAMVSAPSLAQTSADKGLSVRGEAVVSAPADSASLMLGVQNSAADADSAVQENNRLMQRLNKALLKAGVDEKELSTANFSVQPQWQPRPRNAEQDWQPQIIGYQVRAQLQLKTSKLTQVAGYIQAAIDAGANLVGQLSFGLEDNEAVYQQALRQATERARLHARVAAEAAGVELGAIERIEVESGNPGRFEMAMASKSMARMSADVSVPVVAPGKIDVRAAVQLLFQIHP